LYEFATSPVLSEKLPAHYRLIYIRTFDHDARIVTGSDTSIADYFRPFLTNAPLTEECNTTPQCNVCGYQFYTHWTMMFPGNMWSASVSYIRELLSPATYREQYDNEVIPAVLQMIAPTTQSSPTSKLYAHLFPMTDNVVVGKQAFAAEHWITSHPSLCPCDWSVHARRIYYFENFTDPGIDPHISAKDAVEWEQQEFGMIPRRTDNISISVDDIAGFIHPQQKQSIFSWKNEAVNDRIRDYFGLAGFIYKWTVLYKKLPPVESWVFKVYPDAEFWKEMIKMYGLNTFENVLEWKV
jgi:hypothetical protein